MLIEGCLNIASSWDWGSFTDWIAAVVTSGAFIVAATTFVRSRRDKEQERPRLVHALLHAMPRSRKAGWQFGDQVVTLGRFFQKFPTRYMEGAARIDRDDDGNAKFFAVNDSWVHQIAVKNGSDEVITRVRVVLFMPKKKHRVFDPAEPEWDYLAPGETRHIVIMASSDVAGVPASVLELAKPMVEFVDASGKKWEHGLGYPLKRVDGRKWSGRRRREKPPEFRLTVADTSKGYGQFWHRRD